MLTTPENVFLDWCSEVLWRATTELGHNTAPLWHSLEGRAVITEALAPLGSMPELVLMSRDSIRAYLLANASQLCAWASERHKGYEERIEKALCSAIAARLAQATAQEQLTIVETLFRARGPLWIDTKNLLHKLGFAEETVAEYARALRFDHDH